MIFETDRADVSQLIPIVANQLVTVQTGDTAGDTKWLIRYSALLWLRKLLPSSTAAAVKSSPVCLQGKNYINHIIYAWLDEGKKIIK